MKKNGINLTKATVLISAIGISLLFYFMVKGFLMTILLSAIFSGVMYKVFDYLVGGFGNRRGLAGTATVIIFILVVLIPMSVFTLEQAINA